VALPAQYRMNAAWVFNSNTMGQMMKLESTVGMPIFPPNRDPDTIFQRPYMLSEFLPNYADSAAISMLFGAFRHYVIAERKAMVIQRLTEKFAPNVGILATARVGGQLTVTSAFRLGDGA
jgi:HK97 family phage major capsid protein